jgi:hypothetical protein
VENQLQVDPERGGIPFHKTLHGFFLCIFNSLTCLKKLVFSKLDLLQWKVKANLSLFLRSEKIPTLFYVEKRLGCMPFHEFQHVPSALGTYLKS